MIAISQSAPTASGSHAKGSDHSHVLSGRAGFAALAQVAPPRAARGLAKFLFVAFGATLFGLLFLPWQQTVVGRGQMIAFKPNERKQSVSAPIAGLVQTLYVVEGRRVKTGDPIADLVHPNPNFERDLTLQKTALENRLTQFQSQIDERTKAIAQQKTALAAALIGADETIAIANQTVTNREKVFLANQEREQLAKAQFELIRPLLEQGVISGVRLLELKTAANVAEQATLQADADRIAARNAVSREKQNKEVLQANLARDINASLEQLSRIQGDMNSAERDLKGIEIQLATYAARFVKAPCDGTIFSLPENSSSGGGQVKEGDTLAVIVPDSQEFVVELFIDGIDAPLIQKGPDGRYPHVRLQFEGWPAVQFTGWPSAAYGTFGGRVKLIDQTTDGKGKFRILIEPDSSMFPDDVWPSSEFLRQGNQAVGWVFLNRVTLGWELWRRMNGFPPIVAPQEPSKSSDSPIDGKPVKVKPG
jgi:membrane fusion protein, adhesin transport system